MMQHAIKEVRSCPDIKFDVDVGYFYHYNLRLDLKNHHLLNHLTLNESNIDNNQWKTAVSSRITPVLKQYIRLDTTDSTLKKNNTIKSQRQSWCSEYLHFYHRSSPSKYQKGQNAEVPSSSTV
jgi:hypothetical protein